MEKLAELNAKLSDLHGKMDVILADAKENNDGKLSGEKKTEFDKFDAEYDATEKERDELSADIKLQEKQAARKAELELSVPARKTEPNHIGTNGGVEVLGEGFEKDPKCGFESPREFLMSVMETGTSGKFANKQIQSLAVGSDEGSTVSDPYGGFLLPTGFSPDLMSIGIEGDPTTGRTTAIPMENAVLEIPARVDKNHTSSVSGGLRVYRRNETDTSASSRTEFEQVKLVANALFGVAYATEELLSRSPISFIALLEAGFSDEFAAKVLKEKLFGTGTGEMEGVMNSAATVSVAKDVGQAADTLTYENIINMRSRVWGYGNAIWTANHDALPQLMLLNQSVGTGGVPVWQPSAREDHPDMLLGRPLFFTEFAETVGTTGDILCGNWSQYLEGTLSGPQQAESIHVRFINHERTFKFWMENDGRLWWRSALTPNKSSTTLSPFVKLDSRD